MQVKATGQIQSIKGKDHKLKGISESTHTKRDIICTCPQQLACISAHTVSWFNAYYLNQLSFIRFYLSVVCLGSFSVQTQRLHFTQSETLITSLISFPVSIGNQFLLNNRFVYWSTSVPRPMSVYIIITCRRVLSVNQCLDRHSHGPCTCNDLLRIFPPSYTCYFYK